MGVQGVWGVQLPIASEGRNAPTWGPRKVSDFVGKGGARERAQFSPQGGNGDERTLRRRAHDTGTVYKCAVRNGRTLAEAD